LPEENTREKESQEFTKRLSKTKLKDIEGYNEFVVRFD